MTTPSPERIGSPSNLPSRTAIAVKQPPDIAPMLPPVPLTICACCSASNQAVAQTRRLEPSPWPQSMRSW
jgi:hypothetical protein